MRKLSIYGDKPEPNNTLALRDDGDNIVLMVVDKNGDDAYCGCLVAVSKRTGKLKRRCSVDKNLGFPLDNRGRVKLDELGN